MTGDGRGGVAIIGVGMVAATHLAALVDLRDRIRLVGALGRSQSRLDRFVAEASADLGEAVTAYPDLNALIADPAVDWVIVLTPPDARRDIIGPLAEAGKGILLEKPVERSLDAATDIVRLCADAGVPLGLVFQHRMRAASRDLAALLRDGALGPIGVVEARAALWRDQAYYDDPGRGTYARDGGGVLMTQAIHTLDLMLALAGPVTEVQAMAATSALHRMEAEDHVAAGLRFASGAIGSLVASTASFPGDPESLTFHGTEGTARLVRGILHLHWRDGRQEMRGAATSTGAGADPMAFTHAWHRDVIADFDDAVRMGRAPMVTGAEALKVHGLIDALTTSSAEGRAVQLP